MQISDSEERHTMNYCACKKSALDLEEGYARAMGKCVQMCVLKDGAERWVQVNDCDEEL